MKIAHSPGSQEAIAEALRNIRKSRGESQAQFAELLGVERNTVARYEMGRIIPSPLVLLNLRDLVAPEEMDELREAFKPFLEHGAYLQSPKKHKPVPPKLRKLLDLTFRLAQCKLDKAVVEILELGLLHSGKKGAARHFRDAAAFLKVQLARDAEK